MKLRRQQIIMEIIKEKAITTQGELADELLARGVKTTQATISRDIKELQLVKIPIGSDSYRYALPQQMEPPQSDKRLQRLFRENLVKYDYSENLILLKTLPGAAHNVAEALDRSGWKELLGTVAGDDTILLIIKPREAVEQVMERIDEMLR
ncbi:MAG: arginine repressor [Syntrophaceticus sp.]